MKLGRASKFSSILIFLMIVIIIGLIIILFRDQIFSKSSLNYNITLVGNKYITINADEEYVEPGYSALDSNNNDVTGKVKIVNEIKENTPGIYRIIYQIDDYFEYRIVEIKELVDPKLEIFLDQNKETITNSSVIINVLVEGETFASLILPDGSVIDSNMTSYTVNINGVYKFEAINSQNESFVKEITINNIDKEAPSGTCVATLTNSNTSIEVKLNNEESVNYSYYDNDKLVNTSESNNYTIDYKTSDTIFVVLEDKATNQNKIKCTTIDKRYFEQIKPSNGQNIVYQGDTDSLKAYIVKGDNYYLTYIWVKNAYMQLNKFDSPEYGRELYKPASLLSKTVASRSLQGKMLIGFNASGFYLKDTYDAASVNSYSAYDRTSVGTLVITDGKVVRNAYTHAVKTWYTVGVNKDNKLLVFEDAKSSDANAKKTWSESVIASGIRNTFTFAAPLLQNGQRTNITTSMPGGFDDSKGLQIICQINDNNFLLFTARNSTRNTALNEFNKLGCQTAMNLDGGGSIGLLYKEKNSDEIKVVIGGARQLPEVGYFAEE